MTTTPVRIAGRILDPYTGGYEEPCDLEYKIMYSVESQPPFRRNFDRY
jgi:hypothetical protein